MIKKSEFIEEVRPARKPVDLTPPVSTVAVALAILILSDADEVPTPPPMRSSIEKPGFFRGARIRK